MSDFGTSDPEFGDPKLLQLVNTCMEVSLNRRTLALLARVNQPCSEMQTWSTLDALCAYGFNAMIEACQTVGTLT